MQSSSELMADVKFYSDYSRFDENTGKYEAWDEAVDRVMVMHETKYADILKKKPELKEHFEFVRKAYKNKQILGAQRALQFGGDQILKKNAKMYNCVSSYADRPEFFGEFMWLMLCGCGAGASVQKQHVAKLPKIKTRGKSVKRFEVPDSIEGWAKAFDVLLSSFFDGGGKHPEFEEHPVWFDLSKIRAKGSFISGGFKAPGPEPLDNALRKVELLLTKAVEHKRLKPIEVYDACMFMADAVISVTMTKLLSDSIPIISDDIVHAYLKLGDFYHVFISQTTDADAQSVAVYTKTTNPSTSYTAGTVPTTTWL